MPERNRILVTGGAGFIGSHLVDLLIAEDKAVTVLDDFSTGQQKNLVSAEKKGDLKIIKGSVLDLDAIQTAMEHCTQVYHLAVACVRRSLELPLENHDINATGTLNTLEIARQRKIKRFVYCSSSEVYGNSSDSILNEEKTVCQPMTVYGGAKLAGEHYAKAYYQTYKLPAIIIRPFNAYGPRAHDQGRRAEVIPRFMIRLLNNLPPIIFGDGSSARDFTYVTEIAEGLKSAMSCDALIGRELNIAYGQAITIQEVATTLATVCGKSHIQPIHMDSRPGDVPRLHASTAAAKKYLNYTPRINFEEGLKNYLDWFTQTYTDVSSLLEPSDINWTMPNEGSHGTDKI